MTAPTPPRSVLARRRMLLGAAVFGVLAGCNSLGVPLAAGAPSPPTDGFEVTHTDAEWRQLLSPQQYAVLRTGSTEMPYSSPLNDEHRTGIFGCAGCGQDLFSSATKFDSGTGWPSFWKALSNAVLERRDNSAGMTRTEVLCSRCGGHLGHVFDDGPEPTGLRYCMNGVALRFRPA
ncbi:peptide-methionine (R)-S-oxide reductase MsrB [Mycobacterium florentinum]|nr:peptide-methionine (R)-S-oxide reductase MsrB [Mycobacterium florentinum]MCV7409597.1 peptide-methionine (R)-S-oxide reductase MsrB [Mycobacterium florentinum]BBX78891.1 putative methionine sulfoxide reductase [Mycobacterium florentinum]